MPSKYSAKVTCLQLYNKVNKSIKNNSVFCWIIIRKILLKSYAGSSVVNN